MQLEFGSTGEILGMLEHFYSNKGNKKVTKNEIGVAMPVDFCYNTEK